MAGATARIPTSRRTLIPRNYELCGEAARSPDMVFGFFEDGGDDSPWTSSGSEGSEDHGEGLGRLSMEDEEEEESGVSKNKAFWEDQHQILQATLYRTSSLESKIRNVVKAAVQESKQAGTVCVCVCGKGPAADGGCRMCSMREVCGPLQDAGFNCGICKTKWRSSPDIPSGEHTFLDVVDNSSPRRGEVRVIIELNFRAGFEMARAGDEYNRLIERLPEVFVGKVERLQGLIKVLCSAAKKCMKQNKMHLGPWRKQKYVQAKWLGTVCQRTTDARPSYLSSSSSSSSFSMPMLQNKPKRSMLTVHLMERLPNLHFPAVEVL